MCFSTYRFEFLMNFDWKKNSTEGLKTVHYVNKFLKYLFFSLDRDNKILTCINFWKKVLTIFVKFILLFKSVRRAVCLIIIYFLPMNYKIDCWG